ncbi:potassium channel family protein [Kitasatospora sp. NPDC094028]
MSRPSGARSGARQHRRRTVLTVLRILLSSAGLVAAYFLLPLDREFTAGTIVTLVGGLVGVALLLVWQTIRIVRSPSPRLRAAEAVATTVPLFLLLFSSVYYLLERDDPGSFSESMSRTDALYFSVTVFSTVGFGDITARTGEARLLATGQMIGDLLLIGVVARVMLGAVQEGLRRHLPAERSPHPGSGGEGDD